MKKLNEIWARRNECTMVLATKVKQGKTLVRLNSQPTYQQFVECCRMFNKHVNQSRFYMLGNECIIECK